MQDKRIFVERCKEIYLRQTGKILPEEEALEMFERLISLVSAIYKPIPKNK